jgi:pyruvate, orthophosphate dikinase
MPMQRQDFVEIFRAMNGLPVTIRLLDPPLHEFLPSIEELINEVSRLKEFSQIINALEQLPGTVSMLDPELYKRALHRGQWPGVRRSQGQGSGSETLEG